MTWRDRHRFRIATRSRSRTDASRPHRARPSRPALRPSSAGPTTCGARRSCSSAPRSSACGRPSTRTRATISWSSSTGVAPASVPSQGADRTGLHLDRAIGRDGCGRGRRGARPTPRRHRREALHHLERTPGPGHRAGRDPTALITCRRSGHRARRHRGSTRSGSPRSRTSRSDSRRTDGTRIRRAHRAGPRRRAGSTWCSSEPVRHQTIQRPGAGAIAARMASRTADRTLAGTAFPGRRRHSETLRLSASHAPAHRGHVARCFSICTQVA